MLLDLQTGFSGGRRWSGIPISLKILAEFILIDTVKGFSVVNEAEVVLFFFLIFLPFGVQLLSAQEKEWLPIMMTEVIETLKPGRDPASHL